MGTAEGWEELRQGGRSSSNTLLSSALLGRASRVKRHEGGEKKRKLEIKIIIIKGKRKHLAGRKKEKAFSQGIIKKKIIM